MPTNDYSKFRGILHYAKPTLMNQIDVNFKHFLDWAFLKIGAWQEVTSTTSGVYGGDFYTLMPVEDLSYSDYQVYQGIRKDWVWETGVNYEVNSTGFNPTGVSVYVNGVQKQPTSSGFEHHINYPMGRVIFSGARSSSDDITANYSFRSVQTYISDEIPWWFEVQYDTFDPADLQWTSYVDSGGDYSVSAEHRIQLPAIIIESVARGGSEPYELGNLNARLQQDVLFHIVTENKYERSNLVDIMRMQKDKSIWFYDIAAIQAANSWPLDYRGMVVSGALNYESFVNTESFLFHKCYIKEMDITEIKTQHPSLFLAVARATLEVIL